MNTFYLKKSIEILERTPQVLTTMLSNISNDWTSNNEGGNSWSVYDIIGHLIHGEKTDWMPRANIILSNYADKNFQPFDRFAQENDSKGKSLADLLLEFKSLRESNLQQLQALDISAEQLAYTGIHPAFGDVTLRQLLATWVVHDLNHIGQIARVMARQYEGEVGPWVEYLGILKK